ncbi:MAG: hypothetical protein AAFQ88_03880 [Pseudomonadota bacterium]
MNQAEGDRAVVYFLLHVPKCAGTSVEQHFEGALGEGFLRAPRWEHFLREVLGNRYSYGPQDPRLAPVRAVSGHSLSVSLKRYFAPRPVEECVLLRDPLGFFVSMYNYRHARAVERGQPVPPPFERWYGRQRRNPVSQFLLTRYFEVGVPKVYTLSSAQRLAYLEERLQGFRFVGSYKRATEMIAGVSEALGIEREIEQANVLHQRYWSADALSDAMRGQILRENRLDQVLFERWAARGWRDGAEPLGPAPALPTNDRLTQMSGDLWAELSRNLPAGKPAPLDATPSGG